MDTPTHGRRSSALLENLCEIVGHPSRANEIWDGPRIATVREGLKKAPASVFVRHALELDEAELLAVIRHLASFYDRVPRLQRETAESTAIDLLLIFDGHIQIGGC